MRRLTAKITAAPIRPGPSTHPHGGPVFLIFGRGGILELFVFLVDRVDEVFEQIQIQKKNSKKKQKNFVQRSNFLVDRVDEVFEQILKSQCSRFNMHAKAL